MSSDSPLEIKVVYDSSGKRTGQRQTVAAKPVKLKSKRAKKEPDNNTDGDAVDLDKPADGPASQEESASPTATRTTPRTGSASKRQPRTRTTARADGRGLILLGLMSLIVAGGLTYAIWFEIDKKFIGPILLTKTPIDDVDLGQIAGILGAAPPVEIENTGEVSDGAFLDKDVSPPVFTGETARNMIVSTAYGWETLSTIGCVVLAMAAGAGWGRRGGGRMRVLGLLLTVLSVAVLAWKGFEAWQQHGVRLPPDTIRIGVAGLVAIGALVGMAIGGGTSRLYKLAAFTLFLSALASVIALSLGNLCGAVEETYMQPRWLGMVFMTHSFWAWMIMIFGRRIAR